MATDDKSTPTHYELIGTLHEVKNNRDGTSAIVVNTGPHFFRVNVVTAPKWHVGARVSIIIGLL